MPKRLSSICFAESPFCAVVADTMGDVFRLPLQGNCNLREEKLQEKHLLLGHFSPVTDVSVAKDRMVTCDRDNKIRLSRFPDAHIIDDFLLGHSAFVTCVCWVSESRVMSGAGDGTLRVWDLELDKQCVVHLSEKKNADKTVVISLEISPKNRELVVAVVHEDPDVHILHFLQLSSNGTLRTLPMSSQPVTGACFDDDGILWVSVDGEESVTGYSLELRHEALRLSQCSPSTAILPEDDADLVENEEEDNDTSSNETLRSKWLLQLRKKPIVENWKGKKRKSADC